MLRHSTKKPGCRDEIFNYFRRAPELGVTRPDQIAVIGDRLFTDIMMANLMGSYGIWIKDGVVEEKGQVSAVVTSIKHELMRNQFTRIEGQLASFLMRKGYSPPMPRSQFEE